MYIFNEIKSTNKHKYSIYPKRKSFYVFLNKKSEMQRK